MTTMGELAASIAHEIDQPLGAIVNNGHVCLRLLEGVTVFRLIWASSDLYRQRREARQRHHRAHLSDDQT